MHIYKFTLNHALVNKEIINLLSVIVQDYQNITILLRQSSPE